MRCSCRVLVVGGEVLLDEHLRNPVVSAPIVGATKPHHLSDAVAALEVELTDDDVRRLEEHYVPQAPFGW